MRGTVAELIKRDRELLIVSGVPPAAISTTSSTTPVLTVTINDPTTTSVRAYERTIGIIQSNSGFVGPGGTKIPYLRDCDAFDLRANNEVYLAAKGTAATLADVIGSRLTGPILQLPLSTSDHVRGDVRCGHGRLLGTQVFGDEVGDADVASTRSTTAFFDAAPARHFEVNPNELGDSYGSWATSLAGVPYEAVAKARYVVPPTSVQIFATGSSLRGIAMLREVPMPTLALKQATWRAQVAASTLGFRTTTTDGLIAYDGYSPFSDPQTFPDPPLTFETNATQTVGVFLGLLPDATRPPVSSALANAAPKSYERLGTYYDSQSVDKRLPFVTGKHVVANATLSVRAPSRTALILFHFHRDDKAFTDAERSTLTQAIYVGSGKKFVPGMQPYQPFDLVAGGWIQWPTSEDIASLVEISRRFASETGAQTSALYRATVYNCLPLEEEAISSAALSAYAQGIAEFGNSPNAMHHIRSIGVLGPFYRQGGCGSGAIAFPPDSEPKRFTQRLQDLGDPDVVIEVSVGITFDALRTSR